MAPGAHVLFSRLKSLFRGPKAGQPMLEDYLAARLLYLFIKRDLRRAALFL
jgi:hypothetical protein